MIPGYHVGALLLHSQCDAITQIAAMGYRCVAIRPRPGSLDPRDDRFGEQVLRLADAISRAEVRVIIDCDAPFMHDPLVQRGPSIAADSEDEAEAAIEWVGHWIGVASELGADRISFSSGAGDGDPVGPGAEASLERFSRRISRLADRAAEHRVKLALRPRCGDAIATVAQFERLQQWLEMPERLLLAADVREMLLGHEFPVGDRLARNIDSLGCVYLCDHRSGAAGDQRIGHGDVAVSRIVSSLQQSGFTGPAIVRVEGHSDLGFVPAREAFSIFDNLSR